MKPWWIFRSVHYLLFFKHIIWDSCFNSCSLVWIFSLLFGGKSWLWVDILLSLFFSILPIILLHGVLLFSDLLEVVFFPIMVSILKLINFFSSNLLFCGWMHYGREDTLVLLSFGNYVETLRPWKLQYCQHPGHLLPWFMLLQVLWSRTETWRKRETSYKSERKTSSLSSKCTHNLLDCNIMLILLVLVCYSTS